VLTLLQWFANYRKIAPRADRLLLSLNKHNYLINTFPLHCCSNNIYITVDVSRTYSNYVPYNKFYGIVTVCCQNAADKTDAEIKLQIRNRLASKFQLTERNRMSIQKNFHVTASLL